MEWIFDHLIVETGLFLFKIALFGWKLLGGNRNLPEVLTFDDLEE
jgi:hypothetical protein